MKKYLFLFTVILTAQSCFKKDDSLVDEYKTDSAIINDSITSIVIDSAAEVVDSAALDLDAINQVTNQKPSMTYEEASRLNTSAAWKQFQLDNPNYENKSEIEDNIIRAQVREIKADSNTGQMPVSERVGSSNSTVSSIQVENDTSCDLTLLYSGPDAKKIIIAPNSKKNVTLSSGNYTVAANACGYNYAGSENLSGDYSVVYYISTVSY